MLDPISLHFNAAVKAIAERLMPLGFDVEEDSDKAPSTLDALQRRYLNTGRVLVWGGASDRTIFGDPAYNHAFRAWHDWCHLQGAYDFTPEGEHAAYLMQRDHLAAHFGRAEPHGGRQFFHCERLLQAEVLGQLTYAKLHGDAFPDDQRGFAVAYVADPVTAPFLNW
jgi:hypothetical protein